MGIGAILLLLLAVINWWRGLPGEHASFAILPYAFFGVLTLITFLIAVLEAMGLINIVAGLNDDVLDSWSADEHQDDLRWLLKQIDIASAGGKRRVHLLCGDIHTGGLSRITFGPKDKPLTVVQVTSSPISYVTMPALVEKLTSGIGKVDLIDRKKKSDNVICSVNNVFFRSSRNFVILNVPKDETRIRVDFYFEDLDQATSIQI